MKVRRGNTKRFEKLLKEQEDTGDRRTKEYKPGFAEITSSSTMTAKLINFFGDISTEVFTIRVSPDAHFVAAGCSNGSVKRYSLPDCNLQGIAYSSRLGGYPNTSVRWMNNEVLIACNSDGCIKWLRSDHLVGQHESQIGYLSCDYQPYRTTAVFGTEKNSIEVFDAEERKISQVYRGGEIDELNPNHINRVFSIKCLEKEPDIFLSGSWDSTVRIWDIRIPKLAVRKFCGPLVSGDAIDERNGEILVGNYSNQNIGQIWDLKEGKLLRNLNLNEPTHGTSYCFTATYAHQSPEDLIGFGLSGSNKVKILRKGELALELSFQDIPLSIDFYRSNDTDFLVAGGIQGTAYVFKLKLY